MTVGSQSLLGLHHVEHLRRGLGGALAVWPFETGLRPPASDAAPVVLAEVWPSLFAPAAKAAEVPDEVQVTATLTALAAADVEGQLGE